MNLHNKRVLITGGARGLGRAFAQAAANAGAEVTIADVIPSVQDTAKAIGAAAHHLDLASPDSIEALARKFDRLDGLVNNAAVTDSGGRAMEELDVATWDRVFAVNVRGAWLMTRALAPALRRSKGRVVNIASDTALWGAPKLLAYVSSKGALIAMTRALARELGADGITVNAIAPGAFPTAAEEIHPDPEGYARFVLDHQAVKRRGEPGDIGSAVLFLASPESAFVTGQLLNVDGGWVMT
jgi:NAD(P)-dependent dehydrogenase (short-subunit alcohol dehydrogenase family)